MGRAVSTISSLGVLAEYSTTCTLDSRALDAMGLFKRVDFVRLLLTVPYLLRYCTVGAYVPPCPGTYTTNLLFFIFSPLFFVLRPVLSTFTVRRQGQR